MERGAGEGGGVAPHVDDATVATSAHGLVSLDPYGRCLARAAGSRAGEISWADLMHTHMDVQQRILS